MASGDRIELLTANAFETAMSTVAKETSVQSCASKIDNVDADIAALAATVNNINNVNTADYQLDQSMNNTLVDLYNNRIGVTNNTGGTAAAGTVMGKLNTIINNTSSGNQPQIESLNINKFYMANEAFTDTKTILNIRGSGLLYNVMSLFAKSLTIQIDGKVIYNLTAPGTYYYQAGLTVPSLITGNVLYLYFGRSESVISTGKFANGVYTPSENSSSQVLMPVLPIRFTSSVVATTTSGYNNGSRYSYAYILD